MLRGRLKRKEKGISVLLIPNTTDKVKALKLTTLYTMLPAILTMIFISLVCIALFVGYVLKINNKLMAENQKLLTSISGLADLNKEKAAEITELKQIQESMNKKIKDFTDKYKEITENYVPSRSDNPRVSRSGDRNDRSLVNDIHELKIMLDNLDQANISGNKVSSDLSGTEARLKVYSDSLPTLWPTEGRISSEFGNRRDPLTGRYKYHSGLDIAALPSQDVKAAGSGTVTYAGWYGDYGYTVIIDHGYGISTVYGHNYRLLVKQGLEVKKGDVISKAGSSGRSTGTHLHFEVRLNDTPVDPFNYLDSK